MGFFLCLKILPFGYLHDPSLNESILRDWMACIILASSPMALNSVGGLYQELRYK
jgi:hypothetical protein